MQNIVRTDLSISRPEAVQARAKPAMSAPIELDASMLKHVAGGAPRGTWTPDDAAAATVDAPRGTW